MTTDKNWDEVETSALCFLSSEARIRRDDSIGASGHVTFVFVAAILETKGLEITMLNCVCIT